MYYKMFGIFFILDLEDDSSIRIFKCDNEKYYF